MLAKGGTTALLKRDPSRPSLGASAAFSWSLASMTFIALASNPLSWSCNNCRPQANACAVSHSVQHPLVYGSKRGAHTIAICERAF